MGGNIQKNEVITVDTKFMVLRATWEILCSSSISSTSDY